MMSSFVVVASFVVKDALDERVKGMAGAISTNQQEFERYRERMAETAELRRLDTYIWGIYSKLVLGRNSTAETENKKYAYDEQLTTFLTTINEVGTFEKMVDLLALDKSKYKPKIDNLDARFHELIVAMQDSDHIQLEEEQSRVRDELQNKSWGLLFEIGDLEKQVFSDAVEVRDRNEHYHKLFSRLTYVLFFIGWLLSLISNLAGSANLGAAQTE